MASRRRARQRALQILFLGFAPQPVEDAIDAYYERSTPKRSRSARFS